MLFDAGGTLVHIDPARVGEVLGTDPDPDRLVEAHYRAIAELSARPDLADGPVSEWWPWWVGRYLDTGGLEASPEAIRAIIAAEVPWRRSVPGARRAVERIRRTGVRVAVISNSAGGVRDMLAQAGLGDLFEFVIDSSEVGVAKPDPAIFHLALERMDLDPEQAWYVGDSPHHDLGGARSAGLARAILVDPLGLGPVEASRISSVAELPDLLP